MKRIPRIKALMTPFPYSIAEGAPLSEARQFMAKQKIRHLPVTRGAELLGVVTDRDIKLILGPDFAYPEEGELKVEDTMIRPAYVVDLETPADSVLHHMASHHVGSALVTRKGRLAGIFTVTDACRGFCEYLRRQFTPPSGNDAA